MTAPLTFFLGGRDLEMAEIAKLAAGRAGVVDDRLGWGAKLSHYAPRIEAHVAAGGRAAAVELTDDMPPDWPARRGLALIDHHGARAGGPSSLRQAFALLGLPADRWTRRFALVEANDIDHIKGLFAAGASPGEAAAIRAQDRAAQGVTPAEEAAGAEAARNARPLLGGTLLRIDLAHGRMAAAMDPLAVALWPIRPEALVVSPGELGFFGRGEAVLALDGALPGGWTGGHLPENGFWGHGGADAEAALAVLAGVFAPKA